MYSIANKNNFKHQNHFFYYEESLQKKFLENMHHQAGLYNKNRWSEIQIKKQVR